jgi:acylglycerol lipase
MRHDEATFSVAGGLKLYYQRWRPEDVAKAVIVMLHGGIAHSGWYMNLPQHEVPRGYAVYAYDQRGFGRSPGQRGYISSWREPVADLGAFLTFARTEEPGRPFFLMGHTGSAPYVLEYAMRHPTELAGVFCVTPALSNTSVIPGWLRATLAALNLVAPRIKISARRRFEAAAPQVSHDPDFLRMYLTDPLATTDVTPRYLVEQQRAAIQVAGRASEVTFPLLLLVGAQEQNAAAKAFLGRVASSDKLLREYPDGLMNLLSDTCTPRVLADIDAWLDAHVAHV